MSVGSHRLCRVSFDFCSRRIPAGSNGMGMVRGGSGSVRGKV